MERCLKNCFLCPESPLNKRRTHFQPHPVPSGGFPTTVNYHPNPPGQKSCSFHRFWPGQGTSLGRLKFPNYPISKTTASRALPPPPLPGDDNPTPAQGASDLSFWGRE